MSKQIESQGMRDSVVAGSAASGSWDPYEVWLNRVKKPREGQTAAMHSVTAQSIAPQSPTTQSIKVSGPDLSETARMRALTLSPSS